jgi:hypothetical protein
MALIPDWHPDCVVAIGVKVKGDQTQWVASGFLYGHFVDTDAESKPRYSVYLVTNRHVLKGRKKVFVRFNPQAEEPAREYELNLRTPDGAPTWVGHPKAEVDVAVVPTSFQTLREHAMKVAFFPSDRGVASIDKMKEVGVTEGDFAYVLGFPMGLVGGQRNVVIVRSGSIARIRDALARSNDTFLVDALVFPGNSGGPVVLKPEVTAIVGTRPVDRAFLIGIVRSYVPYEDVAVSHQTGRARVVFAENSGLAAVHPVDYIEEAVQQEIEQRQRKPSESLPSPAETKPEGERPG